MGRLCKAWRGLGKALAPFERAWEGSGRASGRLREGSGKASNQTLSLQRFIQVLIKGVCDRGLGSGKALGGLGCLKSGKGFRFRESCLGVYDMFIHNY